MTRKQLKERNWKNSFKGRAMPAELRAELACRQYRHEVEKLMDCTIKGNLKNHGEHGLIPTPVKKATVPAISKYSAISYLRSTGVLVFDTVKNTRYIMFGGNVVGKIDNGIMEAILKDYPHEWRRIPGTNKVEYRFKK